MSIEAEYRRPEDVAWELNWTASVLKELGVMIDHPMTIWCNNVNAKCLTKNPIFHMKTKHVAIQYHLVREQFAHKTLETKYISTKEQLADLLTKPLPCRTFAYLVSKLMESLPISLRGDVKGTTHGWVDQEANVLTG